MKNKHKILDNHKLGRVMQTLKTTTSKKENEIGKLLSVAKGLIKQPLKSLAKKLLRDIKLC